jgi:hypothetical protein
MSVWTIGALKEHFDQRFQDQDRAVQIAQAAAEKAVDKAEDAQDKRLDGMNEVRDQLKDQAASFPTRAEIDAQLKDLDGRIFLNSQAISDVVGQRKSLDRHWALAIPAIVSILGILVVILVAVFIH